MARRRDQLDLLLEQWARTRRELLGIRDPATSAGMVGPTRCTLSARRDLHAGSRSLGRVEQHWPEVYTGLSADVNRAFHRLPEPLRVVVDVAYVAIEPRQRGLRAELAGWNRRDFYRRLDVARAYLAGSLGL